MINFVQLHGSLRGWKAAESLWEEDVKVKVQQPGSKLRQEDSPVANFANDLDDGKSFLKSYRAAMEMHHGEVSFAKFGIDFHLQRVHLGR